MHTRRSGLLTVREIADELGESKSAIHYALRRRGVFIVPAARIAQTLLFEPTVVPILRAILKGMAANRDDGPRFAGLDVKGDCS